MLLSSARVGTTSELALKRSCDGPLFQFPKGLAGLSSSAGPFNSVSKREKEGNPKKKLKSLLIGWNERCEVAQVEELILLGLKVTSSNPFEASLF